MLLYSKPSQYALRAVSYIVQHGFKSPCQADLIAREENIPKHFLSKILKRLVESKILVSVKGPGGGFSFCKEPRNVTLYEVISVFDNLEDDLRTCAIGWNRCSDEVPCQLHHEYKSLREEITKYLKTTKLSVFVEAAHWKKLHSEPVS